MKILRSIGKKYTDKHENLALIFNHDNDYSFILFKINCTLLYD